MNKNVANKYKKLKKNKQNKTKQKEKNIKTQIIKKKEE